MKGNLYKEADANWMLGDLYLEREDFGQAINHYEKALDFYKTNEIYLYDEALMYSYLAYTHIITVGIWRRQLIGLSMPAV